MIFAFYNLNLNIGIQSGEITLNDEINGEKTAIKDRP